ncbi:transposase, IS4 family [Neisseria meningitidis NM3158]|nr:transposase, IS4 family [Neisseria meningitidis NM3158]
MSTFFQQTAQAMIAKHINRFPLLKLDQVIDWQPIEQYLNRQKPLPSRPPRPSCLSPAVHVQSRLLGQWTALRSRTRTQPHTRIDFNLFCRLTN